MLAIRVDNAKSHFAGCNNVCFYTTKSCLNPLPIILLIYPHASCWKTFTSNSSAPIVMAVSTVHSAVTAQTVKTARNARTWQIVPIARNARTWQIVPIARIAPTWRQVRVMKCDATIVTDCFWTNRTGKALSMSPGRQMRARNQVSKCQEGCLQSDG